MGSNLPQQLESLTAGWLSDHMSPLYPGLVVHKMEIVEVIHGTTTKIRIRVDMNAAGKAAGIPEHLCIKSNYEEHAETTLSYHLYDTEALFYRDLRGELPLPAPKAWFAEPDPETAQGIIVMEDLAVAGARFGKNTEPLTVDEAAACLDDFSILHAQWWDSRELDRLDWLQVSHDANGGLDLGRVQRFGGPEGVRHLMTFDDRRAAVMSDHVKDPERFIAAYLSLLAHETALDAPRCLIHGDTHLGNSYRLADGTLRWLDWQLIRKGRPMRELSYFLSNALTVDDRRASERHLIRHYLHALSARGIEAPGFDEFWDSYRWWPIFNLWCWLVSYDDRQPHEVNIETLRRHAAALDDMDTYRVLGV